MLDSHGPNVTAREKRSSLHATSMKPHQKKRMERYVRLSLDASVKFDKVHENYNNLKLWSDNDLQKKNLKNRNTRKSLTWAVCARLLGIEFGFEGSSGLQFAFREL